MHTHTLHKNRKQNEKSEATETADQYTPRRTRRVPMGGLNPSPGASGPRQLDQPRGLHSHYSRLSAISPVKDKKAKETTDKDKNAT